MTKPTKELAELQFKALIKFRNTAKIDLDCVRELEQEVWLSEKLKKCVRDNYDGQVSQLHLRTKHEFYYDFYLIFLLDSVEETLQNIPLDIDRSLFTKALAIFIQQNFYPTLLQKIPFTLFQQVINAFDQVAVESYAKEQGIIEMNNSHRELNEVIESYNKEQKYRYILPKKYYVKDAVVCSDHQLASSIVNAFIFNQHLKEIILCICN